MRSLCILFDIRAVAGKRGRGTQCNVVNKALLDYPQLHLRMIICVLCLVLCPCKEACYWNFPRFSSTLFRFNTHESIEISGINRKMTPKKGKSQNGIIRAQVFVGFCCASAFILIPQPCLVSLGVMALLLRVTSQDHRQTKKITIMSSSKHANPRSALMTLALMRAARRLSVLFNLNKPSLPKNMKHWSPKSNYTSNQMSSLLLTEVNIVFM